MDINKNQENSSDLYVPIDVSKYFHKTMICAPGGKIIKKPFEIDVFSEGVKKLILDVKRAKKQAKAKRVIFALEPTSYYHQNLYRKLKMLNENVILINPNITAKIRNLNYRRIKTDDIDLIVLAQAIETQKGIIREGREGKYAELRILTRSRWRKTKLSKKIKTSIHEYVDKLWPGFCNRVEPKSGLTRNLWESNLAWAILQVCPNPKKVSKMTSIELQALIKSYGFKGICGTKTSVKVIEHAKKAAGMSIYHPHLISSLQQDIQLLHHLNEDIETIENKIITYKDEFPEVTWLLSIGSISPILALTFIAEAGDLRRFPTAKQLVHYTGLSISYRQSGQYVSKHNHLIKEGNRYLRHTTITIARNLARCNYGFRQYYEKFYVTQRKEFYSAIGAVANKFLHIAYHLMTRDKQFDVRYLVK